MPKKPVKHKAKRLDRIHGYEDHRESSCRRGYDGTWQRLRLIVLAREPLCRYCKAKGLIVVATEVDHIRGMAKGGERLTIDNLQPLCKSCHSEKTCREDGGFGREGRV